MALESIPKEKKEAIARDYLDLSVKVHEIPKSTAYHRTPLKRYVRNTQFRRERRITERHP